LLKYSPQKERFLRGVRLRSDQLARISDGQESVENAVAETLSFQRISIACKNFEGIDKELDLAAQLRQPLKEGPDHPNLFDMLEGLAERRNRFVHQASLDMDLNDVSVKQMFHDLDRPQRGDRSTSVLVDVIAGGMGHEVSTLRRTE
jgi:hypothetical protein